MHPSSPKVAVIGAGIAGITAAYWLSRKNASVTIYDTERYPAMGTSYANGSQLSACNAGVWTTWPMIHKGIKWMFTKDAPFYISPTIDLAKMKWLLRFIIETSNGTADARTKETIRLAISSRTALEEIIREEGIKFDRVEKGILHVYASEASMALAASQRSVMESAGCRWEVLDRESVLAIDPALTNTHLVGGIMTSDDSTGDMHMFCNNLAEVLAKKYSVMFSMGNAVRNITPDRGSIMVDGIRYDHVVIAAGVASQEWARTFGDDLGIYPVKGYSITIDLHDVESQLAAPWVSLLDDDAKIVCSRLGRDRLRVAGTAELSGHDLDIRMHRIKPLLSWTNRMFPGVNTRVYRPWAGLRPMTPSMMPCQTKSSVDNVWYHAGHGHLGWTLSPGTAKLLASSILGDENA